MSSHLLSRVSRQRVLWRTGAAMLLAVLAAVFNAGTTHAAPPAQTCVQPGLSTIIDPAGGAIQVRMYTTDPAAVEQDPTSIQQIDLGGGQILYGYCIDSTEARQTNVTVCLLSEVSNLQVSYLVAKYPPDLANNINQAARQAAIWHYSNGKNLASPDATTADAATDAAVLAVYNALLAEVDAIDWTNPPAIMQPGALAMSISPATAVNQLPGQSAHQITVTVTKGSLPLPGIQVQVGSSFGQFSQTAGTTNASGQVQFTISSTTPGTANITASAVVTVPSSVEYVVQTNPDTMQPFGIPSNTVQTLTATASKEWQSTTTPTATATPTNTPTNTPTATPTSTPTSTPTNTPTSTPIVTGTPTNTPTPTPVITNTPTATPTNTPTATPIVPNLYAVGNLVWLDIPGIPHDGIQQTIEQTSAGVNGVRVELADGSGNLLTAQNTAPNSLGQPGYYLFTALPEGDYQVRFCLPDGYTATLQNQGDDDFLDSDGNSQGINDGCSYYATEVFHLPNSLTIDNADLSRDFGLYRPTDLGDDPNSPVQYPTNARSLPVPADAARHIIIDGLHFGNLVDAEDDGQPNIQATGDDLNGVPDDEDGIVFLTALQPCKTAQIQMTAETTNRVAEYGAFFDWNGDGVFGPGEGYTGQIGTTGTLSETKVLSVVVPCNAVQIVYMRFRLALNPAEVQSGTGTAYSGEVEDYVLATIGDRVWYDNNHDGLQGPVNVEPGVPGVVASVCDGTTGQIVLFAGQPLTTTTDANGIYGFYNLPLASYCVQFDLATLPPDYDVTTQNVGSDRTIDSDANASGRTNATGVLTPGQIDLTLDMGIYSVIPTGESPVNEPAGAFRVYLPDLRHEQSE
jgi:hypothetical protein